MCWYCGVSSFGLVNTRQASVIQACLSECFLKMWILGKKQSRSHSFSVFVQNKSMWAERWKCPYLCTELSFLLTDAPGCLAQNTQILPWSDPVAIKRQDLHWFRIHSTPSAGLSAWSPWVCGLFPLLQGFWGSDWVVALWFVIVGYVNKIELTVLLLNPDGQIHRCERWLESYPLLHTWYTQERIERKNENKLGKYPSGSRVTTHWH